MAIAFHVTLNRLAGLMIQASLIVSVSLVHAADIQVTPDQNLQDVITQANPGDHIQLQPGTYEGSIVIEKPITLSGPEDRSAIIQGPGTGRPIWVQAPNVTLQRLTVQGSGISLFDMD